MLTPAYKGITITRTQPKQEAATQIIKEHIKTGQTAVIARPVVRSRRQCHQVREQLIRLNQQAQPGIIYYAQ